MCINVKYNVLIVCIKGLPQCFIELNRYTPFFGKGNVNFTGTICRGIKNRTAILYVNTNQHRASVEVRHWCLDIYRFIIIADFSSFLLDDKMAPVLTFWLKRFIDWLKGLSLTLTDTMLTDSFTLCSKRSLLTRADCWHTFSVCTN